MRWAEHVARTEDKVGAYRVLVGRTDGETTWKDLGLTDGSTILKLIFKTWDVEVWTERIWFRIGRRGGLL
jgi:hypothetical protein